jgi:predicted dehydrogenase
MNTSNALSRRHFLAATGRTAIAALTVPNLVPASVLAAPCRVGPNDKILAGCIGVGPQGQGVMGNFLAQTDTRVVAVCDVRRQHAERARDHIDKQYGAQDCTIYRDYRDLLARPDIDVVLIATPDHWHVPVSIAAARAGKDIYLEKPMGMTLAEDQALRKIVQRKKRMFQFGTQQRSSEQFRLACELVRNGRIGRLKHIDVWCAASQPGGSTAPAPVPEGLDYEFWLGPARYTPYTDGKCSWDNKTWWFNYDYALGFIAGWGVHPLDIAYWGTDSFKQGPIVIEGRASIPTEGACNTAVAWDVQFRCPDGVTTTYRGTANGLREVNAMNDFTAWQKKYGKIVDHGTAFEGTDGWVLVDRTQIRTSPERLVEEKLGPRDVPLIRSSNHVRNLLDSVRSRRPTICPIEDAVQADILCHLSDIATRLNRPLRWDPKKERFIGDTEANRRLVLRPERAPWKWS